MNSNAQTLDALYAVGHGLMGQDRHHEALSLFRTMLLVDAHDERGWLALATCHEQLDELEKALALCDLAMRACEGAVRVAIARARLFRALGAADEARQAYAEAAELAAEADTQELASLIQTERGASWPA